MKTFLIITLFAIFIVAGCRESRDAPVQTPVPSNAFQFTSYDGSGNIVDTGWLVMNIGNQGTVSGWWQLSTHESGELVGSVSNGRVSIDLHPGFADNNFLLDGVLDARTYTGDWQKIGLAGIFASGTFIARQQ